MNKISIITATYNAGNCLQNLIDSLPDKKTIDYEFIIIDGASKDNTLEIIKNCDDKISYWISESDKGIYDAWNKGIKKSTGNWIMFLGADDMLMPGALEKYTNYLNNVQNSDEQIGRAHV